MNEIIIKKSSRQKNTNIFTFNVNHFLGEFFNEIW